MLSSWNTNWASITKFITVRAQCIVAFRFSNNNDVITKINCRIIDFCSTSFYCWTLLKCLNRFKSMWAKIWRKRSFNWIDVVDSITNLFFDLLFFFRLIIVLNRSFEMTFFIKTTHQFINRIIIFLNNWCNMSKFINLWTLQYLWFQIQLSTWCMRIFFFFSFEFFFCLTSLIWVYSNVRYFHVRKSSFRLFEKILQMLQWRFFFTSIINICFS